MNKSDIFWQTYLNLENSLVDLGKYVLISDVSNSDGWRSQLDVFSPYIADLLVSCCVQIEAISKELYFNLGGTKKRGSTDLYFDEDCLRLIDKTWNAGKKVVNVVSPIFYLTKEDSKVLRPLKNSGKRQGTYWGRAYQAVKHDRYESMPNGNIKALLGAMAALYLLNIYYRNDSWLTKNSDINSQNWSMGSTVFFQYCRPSLKNCGMGTSRFSQKVLLLPHIPTKVIRKSRRSKMRRLGLLKAIYLSSQN